MNDWLSPMYDMASREAGQNMIVLVLGLPFLLIVFLLFLVIWLLWRARGEGGKRIDPHLDREVEQAVAAAFNQRLGAGNLMQTAVQASFARQVSREVMRAQAEGARARVKLFIDFPNFLAGWRNAEGLGARLSWENLPGVLIGFVDKSIAGGALQPHGVGAHLVASAHPPKYHQLIAQQIEDLSAGEPSAAATAEIERLEKLSEKARVNTVFLTEELWRLPGYHVTVREKVILRNFENNDLLFNRVPLAREKDVDAALIMDMFAEAINDSFDIGMILSNDRVFIRAVESIQTGLGKKFIHVGFPNAGHHLRAACWESITIHGGLAKRLREDVRPVDAARLDEQQERADEPAQPDDRRKKRRGRRYPPRA